MTNEQKLAEISVQIRKLKKERDYILATIANEIDIKTSEMKAYAVELCNAKNHKDIVMETSSKLNLF
jgi:hypothetical protein